MEEDIQHFTAYGSRQQLFLRYMLMVFPYSGDRDGWR